MNKNWKYSRSLRSISYTKSRIQLSPARKRVLLPSPKRSIIITSTTHKRKSGLNSLLSGSLDKLPNNKLPSHKYFFTPKSRPFIQLSPNPLPYDLRGLGIRKEKKSLQDLISYDKQSNLMRKLTEEYRKMTKKSIRKLENEREELKDLNLEVKVCHLKSHEFFSELKNGNELRVLELLNQFPELIKEVDSTGQTALHWAVRRQNQNLIRILLSHNVNCYVQDIVGRKAEDLARNKGLFEIADILATARRTTMYSSKLITSKDLSVFDTLYKAQNRKYKKNKVNFSE